MFYYSETGIKLARVFFLEENRAIDGNEEILN